MTRPIKLTDEQKREILAEVLASLENTRNMFDGKVSFSKSYKWTSEEEDISTIIFTPLAFTKMYKLLMEYETEVAWHGIAKRDPEDDSVFYIEDILVYPQVVTGATVNTDQEKYTTWVNELSDDQFNNLKMQGHSHVRMSTSPSGVDTNHQKEIIDQLRGNMFYIFMIWNKRMENTTWVYDMKRNTVYDGKDVVIKIGEAGQDDLDSFIEEAKKLASSRTTSYTPVNTKPATSTPVTSGTSGKTPTPSYEVIPATSAAAAAKKAEQPKNPNAGKKREKAKPKKAGIGSGWAGKGNQNDGDWDEWERYLQGGYMY